MTDYSCFHCDRTFSSIAALRSHCKAKSHALAECEECERIFVNANSLENHIDNALIHRTCDPCNRTFSTRGGYLMHLANAPVHKTLDYESEDDYPYYDSSSESSEQKNGGENTYCLTCEKPFVDVDALNQHAAHSSKHNWCSLCSRDFSTPMGLENHLASAKIHHRDLKCPFRFCTGMFPNPSAVTQHIESGCHRVTRHQVTAVVHQLKIVPQISVARRLEGPINPPRRLIQYSANELAFNGHAYECYLCHSTFRTLDRLNQHLNSPTHDDTEFRCPGCANEFQLISGLMQHIESETCGVAKFKEVADHFDNLTSRFSRLLKI